MNTYYETITNTRGDVLPNYRLQVVDSGGSTVSIYADDSSTPFVDANGDNVTYATTDGEGLAQFWWTPATGQVLQTLDQDGNLVRAVSDFANGFLLSSFGGEIPQSQVTSLPADIAARPTSATLAGTGGAALIGETGSGTLQDYLTGAGYGEAKRIDLRAFRDGVGTGNSTADTDALQAAFDEIALISAATGLAKSTYDCEILLPAANLIFDSAILTSTMAGNLASLSFALTGKGRNATSVTMTDTAKWLFQADDAKVISARFADFQLRGGAGLYFRSDTTAVGGESAGGLAVERVNLYDYRQVGIGSNGSDDPCWFISNCEFAGYSSAGVSTAKGIVLPPGSNHLIQKVWIHSGAYGIILRDGGIGSTLIGNRFGGNSADPDPRTDIWLVPESSGDSGRGLLVTGCTHGNENDNADDRDILIALASGSDWRTATESASAVTSATPIHGASFRDNTHVCNAGRTRGVIFSRSQYVQFHMDDVITGQFPYVLEYDSSIITALDGNNRYPQKSRIALRGEYLIERSYANIKASNLPGGPIFEGQTHMAAGNPGVPMAASPHAPGKVLLSTGTTTDFLTSTPGGSGITLASLSTDSIGGTEAREITFTANSGRTGLSLDALASGTAGELCWAEFDIKQATTEPITAIKVMIGASTTSYFAGMRVEVPAAWKRIAFPFKLPDTTGPYRVMFGALADTYSAGVTDKVQVGRVDCYQAPHRVSPFQVPGTSADNGNAGATLLVRSSVPTQLWNTVLTADRAVTLSTAGAYPGARFRIIRGAGATGAFNLNVGTGPLKALGSASTWCDVEYNGTAWFLVASGSL